ncbi:hypothetical protein MKX01_004936 [Papaver californicum]|nr:hypothetical protein MKX01_004936 [Papaver californicum]
MPVTTMMAGALLGLGTQMYSNALPVFVNQLVKWDAPLQVDLGKMLDKAKVLMSVATLIKVVGEDHVAGEDEDLRLFFW